MEESTFHQHTSATNSTGNGGGATMLMPVAKFNHQNAMSSLLVKPSKLTERPEALQRAQICGAQLDDDGRENVGNGGSGSGSSEYARQQPPCDNSNQVTEVSVDKTEQ